MNEEVVQVVWSKWKTCIQQCGVNVSTSIEQIVICLECDKYMNFWGENKFRLDMVATKSKRKNTIR